MVVAVVVVEEGGICNLKKIDIPCPVGINFLKKEKERYTLTLVYQFFLINNLGGMCW